MKFNYSLTLLALLTFTGCGDQFKEKTKLNISNEPVSIGDLVPESKGITAASVHQGAIHIGPVDELEIPEGFILKTSGRDLYINAKKIISHGGKIITFNEEDEAQRGKVGQSAGKVEIKADNLVGVLNIEMRGQAGGRGETAGAVKDFQNYFEAREGFTNFCDNSIVWAPLVWRTPEKPILENPVLGEIGKKGGDSGRLIIDIKDQKLGSIQNLSIPGKGGLRGPSGYFAFRGGAIPFNREGNVETNNTFTQYVFYNCKDPGTSTDDTLRGPMGDKGEVTLP